ncbi:MAG: hypothetical protein HFE73_11395, partial [Firmicutes bacterium]|nr:hypothetical protein [Bacillota bacterium]
PDSPDYTYYEVTDIVVNGESVGSDADKLNFKEISEDTTVVVKVEPKMHDVDLYKYGQGSISASKKIWHLQNYNNITAIPAPGYKIARIEVDGITLLDTREVIAEVSATPEQPEQAAAVYIIEKNQSGIDAIEARTDIGLGQVSEDGFKMGVTGAVEDYQVQVYFAKATQTTIQDPENPDGPPITVDVVDPVPTPDQLARVSVKGEGGPLEIGDVNGDDSYMGYYDKGVDGSVTWKVPTGYTVESVTVNGQPVDAEGDQWSFTAIEEDKMVVVTLKKEGATNMPQKPTFKIRTYHIDTEIRGGGGTISGGSEVSEGDCAVVAWAVTDRENYEVKYVLVDGTAMPELKTLSEVMLPADRDHKVVVVIDQKGTPVEPDPEIPVQGEIEIGDAVGKPGTIIEVPVIITSNQGIASLKLDLSYDKTALQLIGVMDGEDFDNNFFQRISQNTSDKLVWKTEHVAANVTDTGVLAILQFQVLDTAPLADYTLKMTCDSDNTLLATGEERTFNCKEAVITVMDFIYGDVNDSSDVNINDADLVAKYVAGWAAYQSINRAAADVDLNGKVTLRDAAIIARHIAGWVGYETMPNTSRPLPLP